MSIRRKVVKKSITKTVDKEPAVTAPNVQIVDEPVTTTELTLKEALRKLLADGPTPNLVLEPAYALFFARLRVLAGIASRTDQVIVLQAQ